MPPDATLDIVLRTPWGGPWRRFHTPSRLVTARQTADVRAALADVDAAVRGGSYAAGFVTYEAAAAFGLPVQMPAGGLPLVLFGLFPPEHVDAVEKLPVEGQAAVGAWEPTLDHDGYLEAIDRIKSRIEAGDTYQINFTFRLRAAFSGSPRALMRNLYAAQAGRWSAYVDTGDHVICSASPELFFSLDGRRLVCRPMKGTWPRGYWPADDAAQGEALRLSAKNRAENVMIVDLVRNDLGRLADTGSVRPVSLFDVERYPLQWQMTSTVEAEADGLSLGSIFEAMFPCGSITGAPKHSSMGIIEELESTPRGIYTGAIGYMSPRGRGHFSVAIRSVVIDRQSGLAEFGVGSGVVWDSVDRDEYDECVLKAGMLTTAAAPTRTPSYVAPAGLRLLESMLWTPEQGFTLLDAHMTRLLDSARCFGFPCDIDEVRTLVAGVVEDLRGAAKVRVLLDADGGVVCEASDLRPLPSPLRVALAAEPVDSSSVFLYHKTTARQVYERARASRPDADAVILWNERGEITEATDANIVLVLDGRKVTPPISCGLLPGTLRAALLAAGELEEAVVTTDDLLRASEVWLINSVRGWMRG